MSGSHPVGSLYLHVPFCARQCGYCDFAISVGRRADAEAWYGAVAQEWRRWREDADVHFTRPLETVYLGGGTPSMLGSDLALRVAEILDFSAGATPSEWTIEVNPESCDDALTRAWASAGVSRVSIGVQSFHEPTLTWMGRLHGSQGAETALTAAKRAGFASWSVDLMFGLPGHIGRDWRADLDRVLRFEPPHLSLYGLSVEEGTPLARRVAWGQVRPAPDERYREEYLYAAERLRAEGYEHYEVSSFAREGHRSRHNQVYWSGRPYLGLGNGAHSFLPPWRHWNERVWPDYRDAWASGTPRPAERECIDGEAAALERLWLDLRRIEGIERARLESAVLERWQASGLAESAGHDRIRLTPNGWLVLDELTVEASHRAATA